MKKRANCTGQLHTSRYFREKFADGQARLNIQYQQSLDHHFPYEVTRKREVLLFRQVAVVDCINAIGQVLPPFVVFDANILIFNG